MWSCYDELGYHVEYYALQFCKNIEAMIIMLKLLKSKGWGFSNELMLAKHAGRKE